ncbi:DNA-directed RNA polymerase subunit alpha [Candidatus Roizmanbacteria bacterium CG_4_10_14_0_8_um_filter_35_28]|uniref:DNA-directed RNA polymerase subunit alpha n=3 Tax=Candidatus Roizmaniibacteriota TaxID=1752723 RepID=A0A2M8F4S4_9BACT|nr:MAG: DNA-directed RNA polymerase subunit alpha [Candidatus Roizmanbacteria bacterium CG23_combo_of_CG06-09_8_20_14_all_35_49]PIY70849.1 MAG: DNA-directed RNA polymerase subunit alpha [Candidatus Roizmanbacteria bacterium CG_4_10_14_0_8_um_filter_35_28]PJC34260.1 MAG: DNA-directed RNA polymerase subunit alpha [Candidatus Roizmanbacteria bacterium CG_4_9_14_0_2_um_filter_35_15]
MLNPSFYTKKTEEGNYGKFVLEPLPLGFGHSLGHALRRTILSSLKGSAITNIKIDGASHLFSTLPGIKESVLDIVLNLKQLRFDVKEGGPYKLKLDLKGERKVYGKEVEGEIKPVNKDLYLAEITEAKARLNVEALVEVGVGYSSVEEREKKEYGFIPVDAFFSPIKKINMKIEETRVGRKANYDKLIIEIWTDGTITPSQALKEASRLLSDYFVYILSGKDTPQVKVELTPEEEKQGLIDKKLYEVIIDELNLPSRVINALLREKIETVADLVKAGKERLVQMKGVGKKSIQLIDEELKKMGVTVD